MEGRRLLDTSSRNVPICISVRLPAYLIEILRCFLQSTQPNGEAAYIKKKATTTYFQKRGIYDHIPTCTILRVPPQITDDRMTVLLHCLGVECSAESHLSYATSY